MTDPRFDQDHTVSVRAELRSCLYLADPALTENVADLREAVALLFTALDDLESRAAKWLGNSPESTRVMDAAHTAMWKAAVLALPPERLAEITVSPSKAA